MSMDTVDDLEYAEGFVPADVLATSYCRPTCRAEGSTDPDEECMSGDTCGCPCHDRPDS